MINSMRDEEKKRVLTEFPQYREYIEHPFKSLEGILRHVNESSVDLQHQATEIWAENTLKKMRQR